MESKYSGRGEDDYDTAYAGSKSSKTAVDTFSQEKIPTSSAINDHTIADSKSVGLTSLSAGSKASSATSSAKATPIDADFKTEKRALEEIQQDLEADEEFERLKHKPVVPTPEVGRSNLARNFVRGFRM